MYRARLRMLAGVVEEKGLCGLVVLGEGFLRYFTGFEGSGFLVVGRGSVWLVVPVLEYFRARDYLVENSLHGVVGEAVYAPYGMPRGLVVEEEGVKIFQGEVGDVLRGLLECRGSVGVIGDGGSVWASLKSGFSSVVDLTEWANSVRMVKDAWEVERISVASEITVRALSRVVASIERGVSESEVAGALCAEIMKLGGEGCSFEPIVAFGARTAYPHSNPSSSVMLSSGPVLIDVGARYRGYVSDMTRTIAFTGAPPGFRSVAEAVLEAMEEAIDAIEPGVRAGDVDAVARRRLSSQGLAKYFIHSLGHGLGVEVHEAPRIAYGSDTVLKPGMVITVEPGVYIPSEFGVRIEDTLLVTERGARRLTRMERVLW